MCVQGRLNALLLISLRREIFVQHFKPSDWPTLILLLLLKSFPNRIKGFSLLELPKLFFTCESFIWSSTQFKSHSTGVKFTRQYFPDGLNTAEYL